MSRTNEVRALMPSYSSQAPCSSTFSLVKIRKNFSHIHVAEGTRRSRASILCQQSEEYREAQGKGRSTLQTIPAPFQSPVYLIHLLVLAYGINSKLAFDIDLMDLPWHRIRDVTKCTCLCLGGAGRRSRCSTRYGLPGILFAHKCNQACTCANKICKLCPG